MIDIENIKEIVGSVSCPKCGKENSHIWFLRDRLRDNESMIIYHKYERKELKMVYGTLRMSTPSRPAWTTCSIHDDLFQKTFPDIDIIEIQRIMDDIACPLCHLRVEGIVVNINDPDLKRPIRLIHRISFDAHKEHVCSHQPCEISIREFYDAIKNTP